MLISKEQQNEALKEQAEQQNSDCYDDACLVSTGRMMATQMIFIVTISKMGNEYVFKARLVDLESASTKKTVTKLYKGRLSSASELLKFAKELTNEALGVKKEEMTAQVNYSNTNSADFIKVVISSNPVGASLFVDGKFAGKTPAQARIPKGKHKFKLTMKDYDDYIFEKELYMDTSENIDLVYKYVVISFNYEPSGAKVYVDNRQLDKLHFPISH